MNEIQTGETVKFTAEAIEAFLKNGDDVSGYYKVVASTETHLSLVWVEGGPFPIPGVTPMYLSAKRDQVETAFMLTPTQQAAFEKMTLVETVLRYATSQEERTRLSNEWKQLQVLVEV